MAPGYGQYNNYYDPVGSQANQPQGYSYHNQTSSAAQPATASYSASSYPSHGSSSYSSNAQYGSSASGQQYGTAAGAGSGHGAGSGSGQDNQSSATRTSSTQQYGSGAGSGSASWGNPNYASSSYNSSIQPPPAARSQSNASPLYASASTSSAPSATFGRLSYNAPTQSTSGYDQPTYSQQSNAPPGYVPADSSASRQSYQPPQPNKSTTEPSRYASPLHAVQAQQQQQSRGHGRQSSRASNHQPSPVMNSRAPSHQQQQQQQQHVNHRQPSTSVEPANTTVDPSQVYDFRAEREKKAKAEAKKRRKTEEAEAAKRAEEARIAEEQRKADEAKLQAEEQKALEERRRAEEAQRKADQQAATKAAAKAEASRKREEQRKAKESKNAATTLASMASSSIPDPSEMGPPANDEEAEMRAMFQKMREFNSKNPAMLAKLWEEERRSHASQSPSQQTQATPQPAAPPKASAPKPSAPKRGASSTPLSGSTSTPSQMQPPQNVTANAPRPAPVAQTQAPETNVPTANTHLWPPGKKGLLAETAARWLSSVNQQRVVTTTEILDRLDLNPNYVQLCESLEATGLRFERAAFARELLRGIPPTNPTNQASPKSSDATIMSVNGTMAQATGMAAPTASPSGSVTNPKPKRSRATKAEMEQRRTLNLMDTLNKKAKGKGKAAVSAGMVDYEMPSFSIPDDDESAQVMSSGPSYASPHFAAVNDSSVSRQPSQLAHIERHSLVDIQQNPPMPVGSAQPTPEVSKPESPPRPPANKEEAARKRGFGDLVDLTAEDSDDDDLPPMKVARNVPNPSGPPQQLQQQQPTQYNHQQQQQHSYQPGHQQFQQQFQQPGQSQIRQQHTGLFGQFAPRPPQNSFTAPTPPYRPSPGIPTNAQLVMQPNGSFGIAPPAPAPIVPSSYVAPPNGPMASAVTMPPKRKGPTNEQMQYERVKGKMVVEPIMRDRVARRSAYDSRTIARDVLLATGRHPDMRPLNSHFNVMQKLLGDGGGMLDQSGNKSDLATIKWDILDPDPPKKKPRALAPALTSKDNSEVKDSTPKLDVAPTTEGDAEDADDEDDVMSEAAHSKFAPRINSVPDLRNSSASATNANLNANNKPAKVPKKRGRKPRASAPNANALESVRDMLAQASGTPRQASSQPRQTPATAPAGRATNAPTGTATGYAAFRQVDENGNVIKKKGRPVGWRKNVHSREAQGLTPVKSGSAGQSKNPNVARASGLQEPKYQVYNCKIDECSAELHSLEVLKKHVTKVHGKPKRRIGDLPDDDEENENAGKYECLWEGCHGDSPEDPLVFEDIGEWLAHVDKHHIQLIAWQLGDGPKGGLSDQLNSESEAYLSDSRGRSVTPIIRPMAGIGLGDNSSNMPAPKGRPAAGKSTDEAHAELQKLKEWKKAIGPSLEKTGVRLANKKRRMGFLDDENFEDVVESEGEGDDGDD